MYFRNSWYVAAWSKDVAEKPFARIIMDEPIVVFRLADGSLGALEDRCPHRHLPLSMGVPIPEGIQCGYHGMRFDHQGRCLGVPSQSVVPPNAQVKAYAVTERYGWVWIWMGNAERADPALIPDFGLLKDSGYAAVGKTNHVEAAYGLIIDNLMDLSHVGYVHTSTIGNADFGAKGKLTVGRTEHGVRAIRLVADVAPPPLYIASGRLPQGRNIDRWSIIDFVSPCFVMIHTGGGEAGTGVLDGRYDHGLNLWVMNAMTPETATTTNYFWATVRCHALDDANVDRAIFAGVSEAFEEDRQVLEAQQKVLNRRKDSWTVALKGDAASIETRRVLEKLISDENQDVPVAGSALTPMRA